MVSKSKLQQSILDAQLDPFLKEHGYYKVKDDNIQYKKTAPYGFKTIIVNVAHYDEVDYIRFHVGVRHEFVEQIMYQFSNGLQMYGPESTTMIAPLEKLMDDPRYHIKLYEEGDIKEANYLIKDGLSKFAFPFLDSIGSLKQLDHIFNGNPSEPCPYIYNQFNRSLKGITVAKLLNRPDYQDLVFRHLDVLKKTYNSDHYLSKFTSLAKFLAVYSVN